MGDCCGCRRTCTSTDFQLRVCVIPCSIRPRSKLSTYTVHSYTIIAMKYLPQLLMVMSACLGATQALRCYSCSYSNVVPDYNSFCAVKFNKNSVFAANSVVECDGVCVKSSGEILGLTGVERKCDTNQTLTDCSNACGAVQGADISGCMHCCNTDLCNGASSVTFDLLAAAAMLIITGATVHY